MSYNLVDSTTGALTRVAGRGKAEYGASAIRSGTYVPSSSVQIQEDLAFSVTFDTPMPDTDYQVIFGSASNGASSGTIQCVVRSRETTGFTGILRNVGTSPISVASGTFTWFAFKLYSDVEYSNIVNSMPSDASASNKLVTESDTNSTTLTSTDSLASWAGNAKGVMTAFIGTSSKPSDIGTPLSSWGETMIWCIGHEIRKTLFAIDFSVTPQVIYTRQYFNGSFISNWTPIKDGNLTSTVTSGSTAPITSGALYPVAITTPTPVSGVTGGNDLIYGFKSGKMVTIVLNGIIMANNIAQNQSIFTNVPTAVGNKNIYFTVLDYENGKLAVMSIIGDSLAAAFQSDDKSAVHAGRYWGTVTYMTSD